MIKIILILLLIILIIFLIALLFAIWLFKDFKFDEYFHKDLFLLPDCNFRSIVKNSIFHIFEEVSGEDPIWYIAKRTSLDGIHFSDRSESLLERSDFDRCGQADPTVIIENIWRMYFDALTEDHVWDRIGLALSTNGESWVKYGPILRRGGNGSWDDKSIHHPVIIKHEDIYYLFYSGSSHRDKHIIRSIGLATSKDGIHFIKHLKNPLLIPGPDWDKNYVRPSRPFQINDLWYMLYWGYNGKYRSIGLATSNDLITWTKWGKLIENATASDVIVEWDDIGVWYTVFTSPNKNSLNYKNFNLSQILKK